jgi:hypothetical protein
MASKFLTCGCKVFSDGGTILCGQHAFEYNEKRKDVGKVFTQVIRPEDQDGKNPKV